MIESSKGKGTQFLESVFKIQTEMRYKIMTKQEKENYKDTKAIGVYAMCNFGGLEVLAIEYGIDDYVIACFDFGNGRTDINRHKIEYSVSGRQYFRKHGKRYYFDEILRA